MLLVKKRYFIILMMATFSSCDNIAQNKPGSSKSTASSSSSQFTEGKDYTIFERTRVMDQNGFAQPVEAYSILIPKGWTFTEKIDWYINSMYPGKNGTFSKLKASSPDGAFVFEIMPTYIYVWQNDPIIMQLSGPNTEYSGVLQPVDAEQYLRTVMLSSALQNATITQVQQNPEAVSKIQNDFAKAEAEIRQYGGSPKLFPSAITASLKWKDGSEGKFICGMGLVETTMANNYTGTYSTFYTGSVNPRILMRYPAGKKEEGEKLFSTMLSSLLIREAWSNQVNAYWKQWRNQRDVAHRQKIAFMDEQTRQIGKRAIQQGQENLNRIDANMRSWEQQQQSQDRMHNNFVKTIRGVENYQDANGKVELSAGYNHAWSRGDGSSYILSNNPNFDPSSVLQDQRWKELKQVD